MVGMNFTAVPHRGRIVTQQAPPVGFGRDTGKLADLSRTELDTFKKQAQPPDAKVVLQANRLKEMLLNEMDGEKRKANAVSFYHAMNNQLPLFHETPRMEEKRLTDIENTARAVREMSPAQKVELIGEVMGTDSPQFAVAKALLLDQKMPLTRDVFNVMTSTFQPQDNDVNAASVAGHAAAFGALVVASVVLPFAVVSQPGTIIGGLLQPSVLNMAARAAAAAALIAL